jgi:hypothetical protein
MRGQGSHGEPPGDGQRIQTMDPDHGGSRGVLGIIESAEGMTYIAPSATAAPTP